MTGSIFRINDTALPFSYLPNTKSNDTGSGLGYLLSSVQPMEEAILNGSANYPKQIGKPGINQGREAYNIAVDNARLSAPAPENAITFSSFLNGGNSDLFSQWTGEKGSGLNYNFGGAKTTLGGLFEGLSLTDHQMSQANKNIKSFLTSMT